MGNSESLDQVRNIGIIAHIDAGKTTTTERVLYFTGRTHRLGSVDEGTAVTDWMPQEQERGITIVSAAVSANWRDHRINLIDTPGHIDFTAEVQRALRVLDGAIVVFDAVRGVEPQSETVWRQADRYRVPRICFINKMDRVGADFDQAIASITRRLGARPVCLQRPLGREGEFRGVVDLLERRATEWRDGGVPGVEIQLPVELADEVERARSSLVEDIVETDDVLLAQFLDGTEPPVPALRAALRRAVLAARLFPVYCGAALRNIAVQPLLDGVVDFLPSPVDVGAVTGSTPDGQSEERHPHDDAPLTALVFKVVNDAYVGHLVYVRVYSGVLRSGQGLFNATRGEKDRSGRLLRMYANHREELDTIRAGDIGAVLGLKTARTGDTLCDAAHPLLLESITFPEPVIHASVEPRRSADVDRLTAALTQLSDEDPTFFLRTDEDTGQLVVSGMGELHLEIMLDRVRRDHGIEARLGRPQVAYKETVTRKVSGVEGRCVRQTGGHGQYGHVIIDLAPGSRGSGLRFENAVTGGAIDKQFIPAIERGVRDAMQSGLLAGHPVTDVCVRLTGGSQHPVDSSELAFRTAGADACRRALQEAGPVLLEPVCRIEVITPQEYTGALLGGLIRRRAEITSNEPGHGGVEIITGEVPLVEMFGYVTELRSQTHGRGAFTLEFLRYGVAPAEAARG